MELHRLHNGIFEFLIGSIDVTMMLELKDEKIDKE